MTEPSRTIDREAGRSHILVIISALAIIVTLRACVFRPGSNHPGSHFNRGRNAAWLGVEWVMEPHTTEQVAKLTANLRARQITTIYVYVSYLKPSGDFNPTYAHAADFVSTLRRIAPMLDVQGWIGIPTKVPPGSPLPSGYIDLTNTDSRATIIRFSRFVVTDLGFDGVHLDPEPILTGDTSLLTLLDEVRSAIGPQARLSIAGREITPLLPEADLIVNRWFTWRADYYREVAAHVDQIAVMAYDSHAPIDWVFEHWMRFQVIQITTSLNDTSVEIFIGIPTSEEHSAAHDPAVENMTTGLIGLIWGLNDLDVRPNIITGVAIYPYWETTDDEWATYRSLWLGQPEN